MTKEINELLKDHFIGIHFGTAQFIAKDGAGKKEGKDYEKIYPMCMSIGYNPYFDNAEKTCVNLLVLLNQNYYRF